MTGLPPDSAGLPFVLALVLAVAVGAGAAVAVSTRDGRMAVLGLLVALLAAPFLAVPLPDLRGVAARVVGAILAAYPLLVAVRRGATVGGSRGGWLADAVLALAGAAAAAAAGAGWELQGQLSAPGQGGPVVSAIPPTYLPAIAAGAAILVLAAAPVAFAREPLRLAFGLTLGVLGLSLVQAGLAGPPTPFTDLCLAGLLALIGACGWGLAAGARRAPRPVERPPGPARRPVPASGAPPAAMAGPGPQASPAADERAG